MAFTLSSAKTFLQDYNQQDTSTEAIRRYVKMANDAAIALRMAGLFDFDIRRTQLVFEAPRTTGTVSVAAGGTAVTGTGTAFAATDVYDFLRVAGEVDFYPISARASTTALTLGSAYGGTADAVDATYEIFSARKALPSRFRQLSGAILNSMGFAMAPATVGELMQRIAVEQLESEPALYAFEGVETSGTVPANYLWVYPVPVERRVIQLAYYVWPAEASADGDDFGLPYEAERCFREFLLAELYREKNNPGLLNGQLAVAQRAAMDLLGATRRVAESPQRRLWCSEADEGVEPDDDRRVDLT